MLKAIYSDVETRSLELEDQVRRLRQLFKPWPPPTKTEETTAAKVEESVSASADVIPVEEQAELDRIEKLLQKAQITRNTHKKITRELQKEANFVSEDLRLSHENTADSTTSKESGTKETGTSSEEKTGIGDIDSKLNAKQNISQKMVAKKESSITSAMKQRKVPANITNSRKTGDNVSTGSNSAISNPERNKSSDKISTVQNKRPGSSSGRRKVVPAHISAPFQTNPNLQTSKLQTTYRSATSSKSTFRGRDSASSTRGRGGGVSTTGRLGTRNTNSQTGSAGSQRDRKNITATSTCDKTEFNKRVDQRIIADRVHEDQIQETGETLRQTEHKHYGDIVVDATSNSRLQETVIDRETVITDNSGIMKDVDDVVKTDDNAEKLFDLRRDGSSIDIPVKLKKYFSQNTKLRRKYQTQTLTRKVDSPSAGQNFAALLQQTDKQFVYSDRVQSLAKQAETITITYRHLHNVLERLHLGQITDVTSASELLHCKKHLEFVLTDYQEMEELFHRTDFRWLLSVPTNHSPVKLKTEKTLHSPVIWYNKFSGIPGHRSADTVIYNSYKDLERYRSLVFQNQLISAQLNIMDYSAELILPVLKSLDPSSSEFLSVLRCGYELLCISPKSSPVIVKDTIEEEQ